VVATVMVRLTLMPLSLFSERNSVRFATMVIPRFRNLHRRLTPPSGKWVDGADGTTARNRMLASYGELLRGLQSLYREHNCHPLRTALSPLVQLPVFISLSLGVRKLARTADPAELAQGGALWFQDLSVCAMTGFLKVFSNSRVPLLATIRPLFSFVFFPFLACV
jgi:YidC/Oxa1 family membrane protein insertase